MLKESKIVAALSVNENRTALVVTRPDNGGVINRLSWDLHDIEREGHHALAQRVGTTVLLMLAQANPEEFAKFPLLAPPAPSDEEETRSTVLTLIHRSVADRTLDYVQTIDALFLRGGDLNRTDLAEQWATIKQTLTERYGNTDA